MAHNRLEKIGTIYSRITGLIRSGAMKLDDRPLWYEVYQAFPPVEKPMYGKQPRDASIRKIFYPEDIIRAKFHKRVSNLPAVNLSDTGSQTLCQKCIQLTKKISEEKGIDFDSAFEEAFNGIKGENAAARKPDLPPDKESMNIKQIFKET